MSLLTYDIHQGYEPNDIHQCYVLNEAWNRPKCSLASQSNLETEATTLMSNDGEEHSCHTSLYLLLDHNHH